MVRRPIPPSKEVVKIRRVGILPVDLQPQEDWPIEATLATDFQPVVAILSGYYGSQNQSINSSYFNELLVAQGGSGLDNLDEQSGNQPASYNGTDQIQNNDGYKRIDVLVQGQEATIRFTKLDGNVTADIILPEGAYSFDFNCTTVQIKDNGTPGGTYQLIGYYTSNFPT